MKGIKGLQISLLLTVSSLVFPAEVSKLEFRLGGSTLLTAQIPDGWLALNKQSSGSLNAGNLLGSLVPADSKLDSKIRIVYYPGKVPVTAQYLWEGMTLDGNIQLPRIEGLPEWIIYGKGGKQDGKIGTAYSLHEGGTLLIDLVGKDYEEGEKALLNLVRSLKDVSETK